MADDRLKEIKEFRRTATEDVQEILDQAAEDMRYVEGNPWNDQDKREREDAGRPCLVLDELNQYFNQAINDLRTNPLGMTFTPKGNGANDDGAEFYQNKAREIEYRSSAQIAYITAAENMFQQGLGWVRIKTEWQKAQWKQQICIEPVMNPAQVLPGPHVWPDARDMTGLLYIEPYDIAEFKRRWPGARAVNFTEAIKTAQQWVRTGQIDVGEYWVKEATKRRLLCLTPTTGVGPPVISVYRDAITPKGAKAPVLPKGYQLSRERDEDDFTVKQFLTNGLEILNEKDWAGDCIPWVSFYGKILYVDGKKVILSMTRLARDPYLAYCFYRTCEMEIVGLTTKNPYWAYEGQMSQDQLDAVSDSLHKPVAMLLAKERTPSTPPGQTLPLPQRNQFSADLQSYVVAAEEMRRAIQAAMGITPLPTQAQRSNEKSGEALKRISDSSQKGSFHFVDHYMGGITRIGQIIEGLIDKIHDTAGQEWVREADGTMTQVPINDPTNPKSVSTKGDYTVTVSAGPSFESERAQADDFVDSLVRALPLIAEIRGPQIAAAIFALSIKLKGLGPIGDQIVDLLEPPEMKTQDGQPPPDPRLFAAQQTIQQLQQQLQEAGFVIKAKVVEGKTKFAIEQMRTQAETQQSALDRETKIAVAEIQAQAKQALQDMALFYEERARLGAQIHEAAKGGREIAANLALANRAAAVDGAKTAAEHAHEHAMAEHQAQLAPVPVDSGADSADTTA